MEDRIKKGIKSPDDLLYTYAALLNGYKYIRCKEYNIKLQINNQLFFKNTFSKKNSSFSREYHSIVKEYIWNKYNITIQNLIEKLQNKKY